MGPKLRAETPHLRHRTPDSDLRLYAPPPTLPAARTSHLAPSDPLPGSGTCGSILDPNSHLVSALDPCPQVRSRPTDPIYALNESSGTSVLRPTILTRGLAPIPRPRVPDPELRDPGCPQTSNFMSRADPGPWNPDLRPQTQADRCQL